jgi:hypothetical protein
MPSPNFSTLIVEGFTKSNFPPSHELGGKLWIAQGISLFFILFGGFSRFFIKNFHFSSTKLLFFILKMGCGP